MRAPVVVRRGDSRLVPVAPGYMLVEVQPDGSRKPAVRGGFGETDEKASTFRTPEAAASFAVQVLRAQGVITTLDIQPLPAGQV